VADDFETANGTAILDFWQAQDRARTMARPDEGEDDGKPLTVSAALDQYEADLKARGGGVSNVARVRLHLSEALAGKAVAMLTARDFRPWRATLTKAELSPASINRTNSALKAALNGVALSDERINSRRSWELGLATIPDAVESRNVILAEPVVRDIVGSAYRVSAELGLLVEVAAVTGARYSQIAGLECGDVQTDRTDPRLMMPTSKKGRGQKKITRRPVPVPTNLVERLQRVATGKPADAPLLTKPSGDPWRQSDQTRLFQRAAADAGLDPEEVTINALRHSSIVRMLLRGISIRVVASLHDSSAAMIEKTYSKHITDQTDALSRGALLDISRLAS
jgi:integrase